MSDYYSRLQNVLGEEGAMEGMSKQQGDILADANDKLSMITSKLSAEPAQLMRDLTTHEAIDALATHGGAMAVKGGTYAFNRFIKNPAQAKLEQQSADATEQLGKANQDISNILTKGQNRLGLIDKAPKDLTYKAGDVEAGDITSPEDANRLAAQNRTRYNNLTDEQKGQVQDNINNNPQYTQGAEQGSRDALNNELVKQDELGKVESGDDVVGGANPNAGRVVRGGGDDVGSKYDADTGLTTEESGALTDAETTARVAASGTIEGGAELGAGIGLAEAGLQALPVVGTLAGIGYGLYKGISDAIENHKNQIEDQQQQATALATEQSDNRYSFNRPSFGSLALPSFDTSHPMSLDL